MLSKYKIKGLEGYVFGQDENLYKLPFNSGKKKYGLKLLKMQEPNRWRINGKWWSKSVLLELIYDDPSPTKLFPGEKMPL